MVSVCERVQIIMVGLVDACFLAKNKFFYHTHKEVVPARANGNANPTIRHSK